MGIAAVLSAFGLAGAAGLNAYIPLLLVALLARFEVLHLSAPFDVLGSTWAIAVLSVFLVGEVIVDKVPGADHLNDLVQTFVRPAAGAILFAASTGVVSDVHPAVSLVCGLTIAFGVHATKAVARPVVNASTLGFGAPVLSTIEDVIALTTSLVAVFLPLVILAFIALFAGLAYWVWSRRRSRRVTAATG